MECSNLQTAYASESKTAYPIKTLFTYSKSTSETVSACYFFERLGRVFKKPKYFRSVF